RTMGSFRANDPAAASDWEKTTSLTGSRRARNRSRTWLTFSADRSAMPGLYVRVVERAGAQSKSSGLNRTRGITGHADLSGGDADEDGAADALAIDVIEHDAARRGSERLEEAADEVVHGMTRVSAAIEFPAQASRFVGIGVES